MRLGLIPIFATLVGRTAIEFDHWITRITFDHLYYPNRFSIVTEPSTNCKRSHTITSQWKHPLTLSFVQYENYLECTVNIRQVVRKWASYPRDNHWLRNWRGYNLQLKFWWKSLPHPKIWLKYWRTDEIGNDDQRVYLGPFDSISRCTNSVIHPVL